MSQTVITTAFEALKAQQAVSNSPVILDGFVFANVPGLNITDPIDPAEAMPSAAQIVHRADVAKTGVVNENAVVYSVTLGADIGDFEFNWVGLINKASNTLAMIVHAPAQQKVKNAAGKQGNVLTRSFLMQYDGAQTQTEITTPAQTWQIDFTARLAGMDERVRVENIDVYGAAAFLGNGFLVTKSGNNYAVTAGAGYVGGLRCSLAADKALTVATKPMKVWADVSWKGTLTSVWQTTVDIQLNAALVDSVKDGIQHYVCAIAQINADGTVTDLRPKGPLSQQQASSDYLRKDKNLADVADKAAARGSIGLKGAAVLDVGTAANTVAAGNDTRIANALQKGNNLSELTDKAAARGNIGLKGAAVLDVGTAANTVAAGNDTRIANALQKGNNLSELTDKAVARGNIGLKGAAVLDVGTAANTVAAGNDSRIVNAVPNARKINGRALTADVNVTSQDIFNGQTIGLTGDIDLNTLTTPGLYYNPTNSNATPAKNYPSTNAGSLMVLRDAGSTQIYTEYNSGRQYRRGFYGGVWTAWFGVFDTRFKPSAGDVGALPIGGGTLSGALRINADSGALMLKPVTAGASSYLVSQDSAGANNWYIGYGSIDNTTLSVSNYKTGSAITLASVVTINKQLNVTGTVNPTSYTNFDARYQLKGNYTPAGEAYTKAQSDAAYMPKTSAYTKGDSDARYPLKDSVGTLGFASNNPARPYMRHTTTDGVIYLATQAGLDTVSGVANAAKTAAATAQTAANNAQNTANTANGRTGTTQVSGNLASYKTANGAIYMQTIRAIAMSGSGTKDVTLLNAFPNEIMAIGGAYAEGGGKDTDSWWNAWAINKNTIRVKWQNVSGNLTLIVAGH